MAAGTTPVAGKTPAPAAAATAAPVSMNMRQLNQRIGKPSQFDLLVKGDIVTLNDDGTVTKSIWQGRYVWYPAGSRVPVTAMYTRWKDGLVALTRAPNPIEGQPSLNSLIAHYVTTMPFRANINVDASKELIADTSDPSILRIPGNAWLFRVGADGQYTALVDVLVFQSGTQPVSTNKMSDGSDAVAFGSQPEAVSASYWQP